MSDGIVSRFFRMIEEDAPIVADRLIAEHLMEKEERVHPVQTVIPNAFTPLPWEAMIDTAAIVTVQLIWLYRPWPEEMRAFEKIIKKNPEIESVLKSKAKIDIANHLIFHLLHDTFSVKISKKSEPRVTLQVASETLEKCKEAFLYEGDEFYTQNLVVFADILEQSIMEFAATKKVLIALAHFPDDPKTVH